MREVKKPSVIPIYAIGIIWLGYALLFPMYRLGHFIMVAVLSGIAYLVLTRIMPPTIVHIEDRPEPIRTGNDELDAQLNQWQAYHNELADLRKQIANVRLGARLDTILAVSSRILELLRSDAEKFRLVRTFSTYYFPTTISLMKRYEDFEENAKQTPNATDAMLKIESAAENIEEAFRQALDKLYRDEKLDTEVEIEVMEQMLRKDGLDGAADPFAKK